MLCYQETDWNVKHLAKMSNIHEAILDFTGLLGQGFTYFLNNSGANLTKLGLSLQNFSYLNMLLIAQECSNLKIFHIFFTNFLNNCDDHTKHSLELKYLQGKVIKCENFCFELDKSPFI